MDTLALIYVLCYAAASGLYLACHMGLGPRAARTARFIVLVGFAVQGIDTGVRCLHLAHPASSTSEAMAFIAWMMAGGFLAASLRYRLDAAGAFALPAMLVLVVLARVVPSSGLPGQGGLPARVPEGSLGTTHIFLATLGVATFALAAVLAIVYLLQERRLKRRQWSKLGEGTTPLETLDRLAGRCVSFGFPVFTLAIITGAVWIARLGLVRGGQGAGLRPEYLLAVVSWMAFGVLVVARVGAGWQGRRAAWLTLGGFAGALLVLVGYFIRHAT